MNNLLIHIPKNGGMTLRHSPELKGRLFTATPYYHISKQYTARLHEKMSSLGDHHGNEHARWRDINPLVWNTLRPVAIIRNPWDRVVSRYFFAKKVIEIEKKVPKSYADVSSFEAFLEERHKWGNEEFMWHRAVRGWYPSFKHVEDPATGKIASNIDVLRFENYTEDYQQYFGLITAPKKRNVTAINKRSYKDTYTDKTLQIVADWYKIDIDVWGYDFDTGPTRNTWRLGMNKT